jgi:hypothetical protein
MLGQQSLEADMAGMKAVTIAALFSSVLGHSALGADMVPLRQCRYIGPVMTTCSGLMDSSFFPYTDEDLCQVKRPPYTILATAMGMHKYAVEIRRAGQQAPIYRLGTGGYRDANFSFTLKGALHVIGKHNLLVIRPADKNRVVEVWRRGKCQMVPVDVDALEKNAVQTERTK